MEYITKCQIKYIYKINKNIINSNSNDNKFLK